ncbi:glycosyl hydrolase catalytic core-domain-containing protein [Bipolaris maydis]|nr:glycosyl hydrolase catalytic core-domain-containing protein [Bipolaris maydis]
MQLYVLATLAFMTAPAQSELVSQSKTQNHSIFTRANIVPKKAGLSGYPGIQTEAGFASLAPYIGWYSDYNPDTPDYTGVQGVPMLWGGEGSSCSETSARLKSFENAIAKSAPKLMFGFYEPDCSCPFSSSMTVTAAVSSWNSHLAPLATNGTILGSPSLCKQKDEDFLIPFKARITHDWDVTSIHINKLDLAGLKADIEHYRTYGKPIFVSEFACVDDRSGFTPCTNQGQINDFISQAVTYFESQPDIIAYGPSNGAGLGSIWPLLNSAGELSPTGHAYLKSINYL